MGANPTHPLSSIVLTRKDGLRDSQVRQDSVLRSRDGRIWFVTTKEIASVNPADIHSIPAFASVEGVMIDGQLAPLQGILTIPPGHHHFELLFTAPALDVSQEWLQFRYRLQGWDQDWVAAGNTRTASYNGISPGTYRFSVMSSSSPGIWSSAGDPLVIAVQPHFYQTFWFYAICLLTVAGVVWALYKRRVAEVAAQLNFRHQERLEERSRIARDLHDTLLQGVLGVSMQIYVAEKQVPAALPPN
jgi:hypothetical protein